jgi:hypothetical protein
MIGIVQRIMRGIFMGAAWKVPVNKEVITLSGKLSPAPGIQPCGRHSNGSLDA